MGPTSYRLEASLTSHTTKALIRVGDIGLLRQWNRARRVWAPIPEAHARIYRRKITPGSDALFDCNPEAKEVIETGAA